MVNNPINAAYDLFLAKRRLNWSRKKLYNYSSEKFREIIHYAYNWSPYYHRLFKLNSLNPYDIKGLGDLSKIPITTKKDLKDNIENIYSKEFSLDQCQRALTGGSTGIPMEIRYNWGSSNYSRVINIRSHTIWGLGPFTRFCLTAPDYAIPKGGRFSSYYPIFNPYYLNIYRSSDEGIEFLIRNKIKFLAGYTSHIGILARKVLEDGIESIHLIGGCGTADQMTSKIKLYFEEAFSSKIGDIIGSVEANRTAWECPICGMYHLDVDSVYTEFLDDNYEECDENEEGQIVYTTLFNKATPIIRFAIEDVGIRGEDEICCPRFEFPVMKKFVGRMDDFFESPEGFRISPMTWTVVGKRYLKLKHFQFVQTKTNKIIVYIVYDGQYDSSLETNLMKDVKKVTWEGIEVYCERVNEIERTVGGKLRCAINKVKN